MPQELVEIQVEQPQQEDDYQEYTELENLDRFRLTYINLKAVLTFVRRHT